MNFKQKLLASAAVCLALGGAGAALAQFVTPATVTNLSDTDLIQDIPNGVSASTNVYATGKVLRSYIFGSNTLHTGKPALTVCSSGGGTIVGSDYAFILTGGTTASTSCVATFSVAFTSIPVCTVASQTAPATTTPSFAVSTTAVTITQARQASEVYDVICVAQPGG